MLSLRLCMSVIRAAGCRWRHRVATTGTAHKALYQCHQAAPQTNRLISKSYLLTPLICLPATGCVQRSRPA
jgi:hypothetical protein